MARAVSIPTFAEGDAEFESIAWSVSAHVRAEAVLVPVAGGVEQQRQLVGLPRCWARLEEICDQARRTALLDLIDCLECNA
jgi:hypothetical protein